MKNWLNKLFGIRYVWVRSECKRRIKKARVRRDPFGEFVIIETPFSDVRVHLNPDGTTDFTPYPEWRSGDPTP